VPGCTVSKRLAIFRFVLRPGIEPRLLNIFRQRPSRLFPAREKSPWIGGTESAASQCHSRIRDGAFGKNTPTHKPQHPPPTNTHLSKQPPPHPTPNPPPPKPPKTKKTPNPPHTTPPPTPPKKKPTPHKLNNKHPPPMPKAFHSFFTTKTVRQKAWDGLVPLAMGSVKNTGAFHPRCKAG